jgi:hypothetical protein
LLLHGTHPLFRVGLSLSRNALASRMAGIAGAFRKFPVAFALDSFVLLYDLRIAAGMFVRHGDLLYSTCNFLDPPAWSSFSSLTGNSRTRFPVARNTAFVTAAALPTLPQFTDAFHTGGRFCIIENFNGHCARRFRERPETCGTACSVRTCLFEGHQVEFGLEVPR